MSTSDLEVRLLAFLRSLDLPQLREPDSATHLIQSGLLDSLGLVRLAIWIEEEVGRSLNPGTFDLATEWNTVSDIVAFIKRES
jgi:acyl carrier protein